MQISQPLMPQFKPIIVTGGRLTEIHLIKIVFYQLIEIFIIS
jgi:hypothetical protein